MTGFGAKDWNKIKAWLTDNSHHLDSYSLQQVTEKANTKSAQIASPFSVLAKNVDATQIADTCRLLKLPVPSHRA